MSGLHMVSTRTPASWLQADQPRPAPRRLRVLVKCVEPGTELATHHEYEGIFATSWDAYEDAMARFAHAARVELMPVAARGAAQGGHREGAGHA